MSGVDVRMEEMVPVSLGWPPPWGWKIVEAVVTMCWFSSGCLKRDWIGSGQEWKGVLLVIVVLCVVSWLSRWYTGSVCGNDVDGGGGVNFEMVRIVLSSLQS